MIKAYAAAWVCLFVSLASGGEAFEPIVYPHDNIFPSMVIALWRVHADERAAVEGTILGDPNGILGVQVKCPADDTAIRVEVRCEDLLEKSVFSGTLKKAGVTYRIYPKVRWAYDTMLNIKQAKPIDVRFKVAIGDDASVSRDVTVTLNSVNSCPFGVVTDAKKNKTEMLYFMFAAYVNEDHPWVDSLLREAMDAHVVDSFAGYQKDPDDVRREVFAVWNALQRRGMKYSNITTTATESVGVYCQHVRLLEDSVKAAQANCVDGSVIFASVLRKLGLKTKLVLIPGHCFLAFSLDAKGQQWQGLETTMMGNDTLKDVDQLNLPWTAKEKMKNEVSFKTFAHAIKQGTEALEKAKPNLDAGTDPQYCLVDVEAARGAGILPIAFKADGVDRKFEAPAKP